MKDVYTQAIIELLNTGKKPSDVLAGVKKTMTARGHQSLYKKVLQNVLMKLEAKTPQTSVLVAKKSDLQEHETAIKKALAELGTDNEPAIVLDNNLIGGFITEHDHKRIDQSYKNKLASLYKNITKN